MKLSIADKLALIYTSAGSLRKVAAFTGLSHQAVGRILKRNIEETAPDFSRYEKRPELVDSINTAFDIHTDLARGVAKRHGLPFDAKAPVYVERLPLKQQGVYVGDRQIFRGTPEECEKFRRGETVYKTDEFGEIKSTHTIDPKDKPRAERKRLLGDRAGALHLHFLPDRLRQDWLKRQVKTNKYYSASIGSKVNLRRYNQQAEERQRERSRTGQRRTKDRLLGQLQIKQQIKEGAKIQRIYTPKISMQTNIDPALNVLSIEQTLEQRHAPAVGEAGTSFADQVIMQLDTRDTANAKPATKKGRGKPRRR